MSAERGIITNVGLNNALSSTNNGWLIDITRFAVSEYKRVKLSDVSIQILGNNIAFSSNGISGSRTGYGEVVFIDAANNELQVKILEGTIEIGDSVDYNSMYWYTDEDTVLATSLDKTRTNENLSFYSGPISSFIELAPDNVQINIEIPENAAYLKQFTVVSAAGATVFQNVAFSSDDTNTTAIGYVREISGTTITVELSYGEINNSDNVEWNTTTYTPAGGDTTINSAISVVAVPDYTAVREIYLFGRIPELTLKDITVITPDEDNIEIGDYISWSSDNSAAGGYGIVKEKTNNVLRVQVIDGSFLVSDYLDFNSKVYIPFIDTYKKFNVADSSGATVGNNLAWDTTGGATAGYGVVKEIVDSTTIIISISSGVPADTAKIDWDVTTYATEDTTFTSEEWEEFRVADSSGATVGNNLAWDTTGGATAGYGVVKEILNSTTISISVVSGVPADTAKIDWDVTTYATEETTFTSDSTPLIMSDSRIVSFTDQSVESTEELFFVGVPDVVMPYISTSIITFEVQLQLSNIENLLTFTSTQATEIINHNTDPLAHGNLAALVSNLEFVDQTGTPVRVANNEFHTGDDSGDLTSIFVRGRAVKIDNTGGGDTGLKYSYVKSSSYDGGNVRTNVILEHNCVDAGNFVAVAYSIQASGEENEGDVSPASSVPNNVNSKTLEGERREQVTPVGSIQPWGGKSIYEIVVDTVDGANIGEYLSWQGAGIGKGFIKDIDPVNLKVYYIILQGTEAQTGADIDYGTLTYITSDATVSAYTNYGAPIGWLICDGSIVTIANYPNLFATIGHDYGFGSGSDYTSLDFNLPDIRGRTIVGTGQGNTAWGGGLGTLFSRGMSGGTETHQLSTTELPAHNHSMAGAGNHTHSITGDKYHEGLGAVLVDGKDLDFINWKGGVSYSGNHTHTINVSGGGGQTHNNMQPYMVARMIIKY